MNDLPFLSTPISADWSWQEDAACRGLSTNLFFQPDHERRSLKRGREAAAKAVCATCPVVESCLDWALSVGERYGVWGGLDAPERVALERRSARIAAIRHGIARRDRQRELIRGLGGLLMGYPKVKS